MVDTISTQKCTFNIQTSLYERFKEIAQAIGFSHHQASKAVMKAMEIFIQRYEDKLEDIKHKVSQIEELRKQLDDIVDDMESVDI